MKFFGYVQTYVWILTWICCCICCNRVPSKLIIHKNDAAQFHNPIIMGHVDNTVINEVSGIAQSRRHKDVLYVLNDSGGMPRLFALNATTSHLIAILNIQGALNCDWEDIAVGTGPYGQSYIYIGDIGGNTKATCNTIYRVREPLTIHNTQLEIHGELRFSWDAPNCETLLVDQLGTLYMVSKVYSGNPKIYRVPNIAWKFKKVNINPGTSISILSNDVTSQVVAGDISHNGKEILLKTYGSIYYWKRSLSTPLSELLKKQPYEIKYRVEPQGEAICWNKDQSGYYTMSEGPSQPLYFYERKER